MPRGPRPAFPPCAPVVPTPACLPPARHLHAPGTSHTVLAAQNGVSCYAPGKFLMQVSLQSLPGTSRRNEMLPPVWSYSSPRTPVPSRLSRHYSAAKLLRSFSSYTQVTGRGPAILITKENATLGAACGYFCILGHATDFSLGENCYFLEENTVLWFLICKENAQSLI